MAKSGKGNNYSIGHLAEKVGLTPRTIRYYEELGLLDTVKRLEGGRRIYTDDDLRRLKFIKRLKILGLTLAEMKELEDIYKIHRTNKKVLPRLLELLDRRLEETRNKIRSLSRSEGELLQYRERIKEKLKGIEE